MSAQLPMVTPDIHITHAHAQAHARTHTHTQAHTPYHTPDVQKTGRRSPCLRLSRYWASVFLPIKYLLNRDGVLPASQVAEGSVGTGRVGGCR